MKITCSQTTCGFNKNYSCQKEAVIVDDSKKCASYHEGATPSENPRPSEYKNNGDLKNHQVNSIGAEMVRRMIQNCEGNK